MNNIHPDTFEVQIKFSDLTISDSDIYSYLGYGDATPSDDVCAIIRELFEEVKQICQPRFGYRIVSGRVESRKLYLDGVEFNPKDIIAHQLKKGTQFAIAIGTVGCEMDRWIHNHRVDDDIMKAFVADGFGSLVAETIIDYGSQYIESLQTEKGLKITNSYSPGYCDWHVSEQHALFSLLPQEFCGVTLCESSLMLPIKSVSTVIGIGSDVVKRDYGCALCNKKDCYKRRNRTQG